MRWPAAPMLPAMWSTVGQTSRRAMTRVRLSGSGLGPRCRRSLRARSAVEQMRSVVVRGYRRREALDEPDRVCTVAERVSDRGPTALRSCGCSRRPRRHRWSSATTSASCGGARGSWWWSPCWRSGSRTRGTRPRTRPTPRAERSSSGRGRARSTSSPRRRSSRARSSPSWPRSRSRPRWASPHSRAVTPAPSRSPPTAPTRKSRPRASTRRSPPTSTTSSRRPTTGTPRCPHDSSPRSIRSRSASMRSMR